MSPKLFKPKTLRSPQLQRKKRKLLLIRAGLGLAGLLALVGGVAGLSHLDMLEFADVVTEGAVVVADDDIRSVVLEETEGNYWKMFSKRNVFLYPREDIEGRVREKYPILASASVGLKGMNALKVETSERSPAALWCRMSAGDRPFSDDCYFLDATGFVYSSAPEFKGSAYSKYYGRIDGDPVGKQYVPEREFAEFRKLAEGMKSLGLSPLYFYARSDGEYQAYLKGGAMVLLSDLENVLGALVNLETLMAGELKGKLSDVEYIDLRFGNKIFFKLAGQELE